MVVVGGGEGTLVDMIGQEAVQGILEGGEGRLAVRVQDRALMFVQMLQEAGGSGEGPHTQITHGEARRQQNQTLSPQATRQTTGREGTVQKYVRTCAWPASLYLWGQPMAGSAVLMPILQMRKLRPAKMKSLIQSS